MSVRAGIFDGLLIEHITTPSEVKFVLCLDASVFIVVFVTEWSSHGYVSQYLLLKSQADSPSALVLHGYEPAAVQPFSISK